MGKIKSEKGFTLLELIFVIVVTGIISSTLILPFTSSINQGTRPEKYNTAAYIAVGELEKKKSDTFTALSSSIGTDTTQVTKKSRTYDKEVVTEFVTHIDDSADPPVRFDFSAAPTKYIRVTITVSNPGIENISMSEILTEDF